MTGTRVSRSLSVLAIGFVFLLMPATVFGHCDGMDGPVVQAAQQALAKGDVNLVLSWVQATDFCWPEWTSSTTRFAKWNNTLGSFCQIRHRLPSLAG